MVLLNKEEYIQHQSEFLWEIIFGLSTKGVEKEIETVNIKDDYKIGESSGVSSLQGNMSPMHADTLDTI